MELNFRPFPVDLTELARAILDGGTREEVIELVKQLDVQEADWSLTATLAEYFQAEMYEYAVAQEVGTIEGPAAERNRYEAARQEAMRETEKRQLGLIDDGTVVLYKPTEGPTVVQSYTHSSGGPDPDYENPAETDPREPDRNDDDLPMGQDAYGPS